MINTLIVEDDYRVADIHAKFLQKVEGVNVVGKALLAKDARMFIKKKKIELVVVDLYMPDQFGIDLISDLKQEFDHLNFIIITASQDADLLKRSLKLGVFYYLIKPVTLDKLKEVMLKYKKAKSTLQSHDNVDQQIIDHLFTGNKSGVLEDKTNLPKGINLITLNKIIITMKNSRKGMTAKEIGDSMGVSRTTARRYLEHLVSKQKIKVSLEYGIVGRPERIYISTDDV